MGKRPLSILSIQPFLKGSFVHPEAGGKDKAALEIVRTLGAQGHLVDILPLPWGIEKCNNDIVASAQPILLSGDGGQAQVLQTLTFPAPSETLRLMWYYLTRKRTIRHPYTTARDIFWRALTDKRRSISNTLENKAYDLILVHQSGSDFPILASRCGYRGKTILIHHSAGMSPYVNCYDRVVFVSARQYSKAREKHLGLEEKSSVIHYFAGPEYLIPTTPEIRRSITFIGVLDSLRKGPDLLLQCYEKFPELRDIPLNIVGDGKFRQSLEERAIAQNLPIRFHGRLSAVENAALLAASGAFVMPSRGEGLALAYLEALCTGLPIVGFPDNVEELSAELKIPVGIPFQADVDSLESLRDAILLLTSAGSDFDAGCRRTIAKRARAKFSLSAFRDNYLSLIENQLQGCL